MNTIIVTGSAGKLGREIVTLLGKENYNPIGVDLQASPTTHIVADIRNMKELDELVKNADAIIHTAALHGKHTDLNYSRDAFIKTNINGTLNLLNACVQNNIRKFVYTSTTSIYGTAMVNESQAVWVHEELIPEPRDIYDITKLTCELLCKDLFEKEGLETVVLRVSRFLPEDSNTKANHRLYRGLDERDGARACLLALEHHFENFEIFNISNLSPFQPSDLGDLYYSPRDVIRQYYPEAIEVYARKGWKFPARIDRVYSIEKARKILNFQPLWNYNTLLAADSDD